MTMKQELKKLKSQRRAEIKHLHLTYLRTKRDVKRAVSPDRVMRKHLAITLGMAALGGFLLAPRLGERKDNHQKTGPGMGAKMICWLRSIVGKFSPSAAEFLPDLTEVEKPEPAKEAVADTTSAPAERPQAKAPGLMNKLIAELAMLLLAKLDLPKIISGLLHRHEHNGHQTNGHGKPRITVADAGAMHDELYD